MSSRSIARSRVALASTFALAFAIQSATAQQLFPGRQIGGPGGVNSVASADMNNDGNADLIVTSSALGGTVSVALGDGHGGFAPFDRQHVVYAPSFLAIGDFDGDGNLDAVVGSTTNSTTHSLTIALGDGHGHLSFFSNANLSENIKAIAVGDFDGDGKLDLVAVGTAASSGGESASILFGDGHGHLGAPIAIANTSAFSALAVGDIDGDGDLDLVLGATNGELVSFSNTAGVFAFTSSTASNVSAPIAIELGDLDHDLTLDAVAANAQSLAVLRGDGLGGFAFVAIHSNTKNTTSMHVGDIDGDGNLDVVTDGASVRTYLGDGHGALGAPREFANSGYSRDFALADFDGDGRADAAIGEFAPAVGLFFGTPFGFDGPAASEIGQAAALAVADLDHDGIPDLVAVGGNPSGTISVLRGDGRGRFAQVELQNSTKPISVALGDFDRDGNIDAVVGSLTQSTFKLYRGDGAGHLAPGTSHGCQLGPGAIIAADFDGDGVLDLAFGGSGTQVSVQRGDGSGNFATIFSTDFGGFAATIGAADIDSDGDLDLVAPLLTSSALAILMNDGHGSFSTTIITPFVFEPDSLALADVDGDGAIDFVVTSKASNEVVTSFGDGHGGIRATQRFHASQTPTGVTLADFDGDGRVDFALWNNSGFVDALAGDGRGGVTGVRFAARLFLPSTVAVADFDVDGRPDIVVPNYDGTVGAWINRLPPPQGTTDFGVGTPGCNGAQGITASVAAHVGEQDFALLVTNAPANSRGFGLIGDTADVNGSYPFGHGVLVHVDPLGAHHTFQITSDGSGSARAKLPIPNDPSLVGRFLYAQSFWHWTECAPSVAGFSSSKAISFEILN